jgi:hypothetical protein
MTMTLDAGKTTVAPKNRNSATVIWAAIAVFLTILGTAAAIFGLAGLVAVMVPAALGVVVVLVRIVTEGM